MNVFVIACVLAAAHLVAGVRLTKRRSKATSVQEFSVVCTIEVLALSRELGPESVTSDGPAEFGECTTLDGITYALDFADVERLKPGDIVSLRLAETEASAMGQPLYKAMDIAVLYSQPASQTVNQQAGFSILAIETKWSDGRVSDSRDAIMSNLEKTKNMLRNASYNTFNPTIQFTSVSVRQRWEDVAQKCQFGTIRDLVTPLATGASTATYRFVFVPREPAGACAAWAGIASVGCGRPRDPPRAGACTALYRNPGDFVQGHELGHNLGLLHAGGLKNGNWVEYGDPKAIMGASYIQNAFYSAPARSLVGWLQTNQAGEVLVRTSGKFKLSSVSLPKRYNGADAVAIKFSCGTCKSKVPGFETNVGGDIFVSFSHGQVYVHLARPSGRGTEAWASLANGGTWVNNHQGNAVHVCQISTNIAEVGMANTAAAAKSACAR
jgi:hypothetical protein